MAQPRTGTVLIVDDEPIIRDSLHHWLEMEGYRVFAAENGEKALQLCRFEPFDIGVFDIRMPGMDGITLLKQTRRDYPQMAVIMMTAFASIEDAVLCISSGAHDYIIKPFPPEKLSQSIRNLMESRHLQARQEGLLARQELLQHFAREAAPYLALGAITAAHAGAAWAPAGQSDPQPPEAESKDRPLLDRALAMARPALTARNSDLNRIVTTALALTEAEHHATGWPAAESAAALPTAAPFVPSVLALHLLLIALIQNERTTPELRVLQPGAGSAGPRLQLLAADGWSAANRALLADEGEEAGSDDRSGGMARLLLRQLGAALHRRGDHCTIEFPPPREEA